MTKMTLDQSALQTEADYENTIELYLEEMKCLREQLNADQQEIDRLKTETQASRAASR